MLPSRLLLSVTPLLGVVLSLTGLPALAADQVPLEPTAQQSQTTRLVTRQLSVLHYNRLTLDDQMSQTIWTRYLDALDGQRIYLLASDVQAFAGNRTLFDNQIKAGQLTVAFALYNRQQQRTRERLEFVLNELDTTPKALLDFDGNETVENDRKDAAWVRSRAELDQLWRLRLKSAALSLRLSDKSDAEIISTLKRRYKSQFTAISQSKPEDAFQLFMNAYTEIYDPHTQYLSPRNSDNFNINMSLQLEGIGAVLQTDDEFTKVVRLVPGGPADKSRQIKPNDRILAVAEGNKDFVDVVGWRIDEVVQLIRGAKNTTVRLQVQPAGADSGAIKTVSLVRNTVALEDQAASKRVVEIKRGAQVRRVGVIKLPTFYADFQGMQSGDPNYRSTTRDVRRLLNELKQERVQGIVLDLRNNGGGSLTEVNDLLGEFISTGPTVQVRDARGRTETLGDGNPDVTWSGPLVVMTNRLSASAAEIFAGAIQDYGRGLVVGSTTFGKGTVQSLRDLSYGQLKITEAKFYRISGASTQNKGVEPDIDFPELFDPKEIGESALDHALPWDTIKSARYTRISDWGPRLPALQAASRQRQQRDPDMRYLLDQKKLLVDLKEQKTTSLNEKARRAEKTQLDGRRLAIENRRRVAKGQPVLKTWAELEEIQSSQNADNVPHFERSEEQALVQEAAEILIDTLAPALTRTSSARTAPAKAPAAAPRRPVVER